VRACMVVLTQEALDPDLFASHTPQGIAVLLVGSVLLYIVASALGRAPGSRVGSAWSAASTESSMWTAGSASPAEPEPGARAGKRSNEFDGAGRHDQARSRWPERNRPMLFAVTVPLFMAAVSVALPVLGMTRRAPVPEPLELPLDRGAWSGTPLSIDYFFPYDSSLHAQRRIEYRAELGPSGHHLVDLFVARELPVGSGLNRIPDTKLLRPASDWNIDRRESTRIWALGIDGQHAILSRRGGDERVLVLAWRLRDEGLLLESLASSIGLDVCKGAGAPCSRVVFRIAIPIVRDGSPGVDRAMQSARRFIRDFAEPFERL